MIKNHFILLLSISLFFIVSRANAQQDTLSREVEVVKSYKPTISPNANKINTSPSIEESENNIKPHFNYIISSTPILNTLTINPLKPATIDTERPTNDGYGLVRAGFGNYKKPYGEIFFNSPQSKNTIFGFHARHLSSHAKIKLNSGDKVKAPYAYNDGEMYVKHLFSDMFISGDIHFKHDEFNYYGYPKDDIPIDFQNSDSFNDKQTFTKGGFNLKLGKAIERDDELNWTLGAKYNYFTTKTDQTEHTGNVNFDIKNILLSNKFYLHTGVNYTHADLNIDYIDSTDVNAWLEVFPSFILGEKRFNAKLGAKLWVHSKDNDTPKLKITPDIKVNFMPIEEKLSIFAGIDGNYKIKSYSEISYFNPYINELHSGYDIFEKLRFFGGFTGKLSSQLNFMLSADYSIIDDETFYILPHDTYNQNLISNNRFYIVTDDIKRMTFSGELLYVSSNKLNILFAGNYYQYELDNLENAFNMPDWKAAVTANYKFSERLSLSTNINLIGERNSGLILSNNSNNESTENVNLDTIVDINISGDYKLTPKFKVFAQLNNLVGERYETWVGYPQQSFNFLAGISYSF